MDGTYSTEAFEQTTCRSSNGLVARSWRMLHRAAPLDVVGVASPQYGRRMLLRQATSADLDEICAMIRELADFEHLADQVTFDPDEASQHLFGEGAVAHVVIAEVDGAIAGMALWFRTFSTWLGRPGIWLEDLFVRPPFRSQGIGQALLHHVRTLTEGRVEWSVLDWNQSAIDVYQRLGAEPLEGWTTYRWLPERT